MLPFVQGASYALGQTNQLFSGFKKNYEIFWCNDLSFQKEFNFRNQYWITDKIACPKTYALTKKGRHSGASNGWRYHQNLQKLPKVPCGIHMTSNVNNKLMLESWKFLLEGFFKPTKHFMKMCLCIFEERVFVWWSKFSKEPLAWARRMLSSVLQSLVWTSNFLTILKLRRTKCYHKWDLNDFFHYSKFPRFSCKKHVGGKLRNFES